MSDESHIMFVAIDVETATRMRFSICQIGLAKFYDDRQPKQESWYVNPCCGFDQGNKRVHGINEYVVQNAPILIDIWPSLTKCLTGKVVVSHSSFDHSALEQAGGLFDLAEIPCTWLDSLEVARRAWPELREGGYKLSR